MITELTPENYFSLLNEEGPLHVVMYYGATCGPCKMTMPIYEALVVHFEQYNITNVHFHRFHHWEKDYRPFIDEHNLKTNGVPTFRYYYMGEVINDDPRSFTDPNELKQNIMNTIKAIESTMGSFDLYAQG